MDTLYIGDIPHDYKYFSFNEFGQIELFLSEHNYSDSDYYTIVSNSPFLYTHNVLVDEERYAQPVDVSNYAYYRTDFPLIMIMVFIICLCGLFITNLFTSIVRKGGVLGGLF